MQILFPFVNSSTYQLLLIKMNEICVTEDHQLNILQMDFDPQRRGRTANILYALFRHTTCQ